MEKKFYTCNCCINAPCVIYTSVERNRIPVPMCCDSYSRPEWREWNKNEHNEDDATDALFEVGCRVTTELSGYTGLT